MKLAFAMLVLSALVPPLSASSSECSGPPRSILSNEDMRNAVYLWGDAGCKNDSPFGPIEDWDTSHVTDMNSLFADVTTISFGVFDNSNPATWGWQHDFNADIGRWDVSNVENFGMYGQWGMFEFAASFNADISGWDVSKAKYFGSMFGGAIVFSADIGKWDVSSALDMGQMFSGAMEFNSDLSGWDVSHVREMSYMFRCMGNSWSSTVLEVDRTPGKFTGESIAKWDVSSVTNMRQMFELSPVFRGDIRAWDTSKVTDMYGMLPESYPYYSDLLSSAQPCNDDSDCWAGNTCVLSESESFSRRLRDPARRALFGNVKPRHKGGCFFLDNTPQTFTHGLLVN